MPITKEILSMFEFNQNPEIALSVDDHFDECALSQERSVPTDSFDASISTHCKGGNPLSYGTTIIIKIKHFYSGRMA